MQYLVLKRLTHNRQNQNNSECPTQETDLTDYSESITSLPSQQLQHPYLGGIHLNYLLYFSIPFLLFACLYSYHMAVSQKQEHPYPHATITNNACHYPQDIVFRGFMLPAGSLITLIYFVAFGWLEMLKRNSGFPYKTQQGLKKWAFLSIMGFYMAIGTIDSAGYPDIHSIGAIFFFIVLFITAGTITFICRELRKWDTRTVNRTSVLAKTIVVGYILACAIYCVIGGLLEKGENGDQPEDSDIYEVIIQWNLTLGGLVWLLTFVLDWKQVFVTLRGEVGQTIKYL